MTHPYKTFKVVPNPSSEVVADITPAAIKEALRRHLRKISDRNVALIPSEIYQALKDSRANA